MGSPYENEGKVQKLGKPFFLCLVEHIHTIKMDRVDLTELINGMVSLFIQIRL